MKELTITISLSYFISKQDYIDNWEEFNEQFYADVYSYGINTDYRDLVIEKLGNIHNDFILSKHR